MAMTDEEEAILRERLAAAEERARVAEELATPLATEREVASHAREAAVKLRQERVGLLRIADAGDELLRRLARSEDIHEAAAGLEELLVAQFDPERRWERSFLMTRIHSAALDPADDQPEQWKERETRAWIERLRSERDRAEQRGFDAEKRAREAGRRADRAASLMYEARRNARRLVAQIAAQVAEAQPELAAWLNEQATPPVPDRVLSPGELSKRLEGYAVAARQVMAGLRGTPFNWRAVDAQHNIPRLAAMEITLVSKTHAERLGYRLKRGAQPVGFRYYEAPISSTHPVYVLECQCVYEFKPPAAGEGGADYAGERAEAGGEHGEGKDLD